MPDWTVSIWAGNRMRKWIPKPERYTGPPISSGDCVMRNRRPWDTDAYFCGHCRDTHTVTAQIGAVWRSRRRRKGTNDE